MSGVLPHNWESERSVIGGLMLAPERLSDVRAVVTGEQFHRPAHRILFDLIVETADAGLAPDTMVLLNTIEARGMAEACGGLAYVIGCPQACMFVDNVVSYARTVADHAVRRNLILACRAIEESVMTGEKSAVDAVASAEATIRGVADQLPSAAVGGWMPQSALLAAQLEEISARAQRPDDWTPGLPTGFPELDRKIGGLQAGRVYLITGRPAMGKSAFAQCIAEHVGRHAAVGFLTLEMPGTEVAERALVQESRVNASSVRDGKINEDDWRRLCDAEERLSRLPIFVDDAPAASIAQIWAKARKLKEKCPQLGCLVLDYLQLASAEGKGHSRQQELGKISRGLKACAKELGIAVVALAQLSRKCEDRPDKRPVNSDLREAGDLEQDADVILHLFRDEVYTKEASTKKGVAEVLIGKNRGGAPGTVEVAFIGHQYRFAPLAQPEPSTDRWSGYQ